MLNALICPNCGGTLPPPAPGIDLVTCQFCGTTFSVAKTLTPEADMGSLLLGADFSWKPIEGWAFPNEDKVRLIPGPRPELRVKLPASDTLYYALNSSGFFDNIDASVSFTFYSGNLDDLDAGLSLRYQKGVGSYTVLVSPLGTYAVGYYHPGTGDGMDWTSILSWTKHSAVRQGLNQQNRLRVIANANHLRVYLNGVLTTSLHDGRFDEGEVLLSTEPGNHSEGEVGFTDLQLRDVKAE